MSIRVTIDRTLCDSQALCTKLAPRVFAMDDDDITQVLIERPDDALIAGVRAAANSCPKGAIVLIDD